MKQNIPKVLTVLVTFIAKLVQGLHLFEAVLGITHNTETAVRADLDGAEKAQAEAQAAQQARKTATAVRDALDEQVTTFVTLGRELLKPKLGARYSVAWREVGFLNSLALSRTMSGRVGQLRALQLYLEAHPELEVPAMLTADMAGDLHTSAVTAMTELGIAQTTQRQKTEVRNAATAQLLKRVRDLVLELKVLLPANDPRWLEFGLNVPGDVSVPSAPEDLVVTPGLPGNLSASWGSPAHSDHFRVYRKVVGHDEEFVALDSISEPAFELKNQTSGAHVQLYVTAVNAAGESVPSKTVEVVVP